MVLETCSAHCVWLLLLVLVPRIFPFRFSQSTLWMIRLGVWGLCLLGWGAISALCPPSVWQGVFGNWICWCFVCVRFVWLGPLDRFSEESTPLKPQRRICSDCLGGGYGFASPKCSHMLPPPNLPWASPLLKVSTIALSIVGGWVCTNRYGLCRATNRDCIFSQTHFV